MCVEHVQCWQMYAVDKCGTFIVLTGVCCWQMWNTYYVSRYMLLTLSDIWRTCMVLTYVWCWEVHVVCMCGTCVSRCMLVTLVDVEYVGHWQVKCVDNCWQVWKKYCVNIWSALVIVDRREVWCWHALTIVWLTADRCGRSMVSQRTTCTHGPKSWERWVMDACCCGCADCKNNSLWPAACMFCLLSHVCTQK